MLVCQSRLLTVAWLTAAPRSYEQLGACPWHVRVIPLHPTNHGLSISSYVELGISLKVSLRGYSMDCLACQVNGQNAVHDGIKMMVFTGAKYPALRNVVTSVETCVEGLLIAWKNTFHLLNLRIQRVYDIRLPI